MKDVLEHLPVVQGDYSFDVCLSKLTGLGIGGPARVVFNPSDRADLQQFLVKKPESLPYVTLGKGSNLLVGDEGMQTVVVRLLAQDFHVINVKGSRVEVGAGCLDRTVALKCQEAGIGGLEFLVGIPGTIGGAIRMNAGANGKDMSDIVESVEVIDSQGRFHSLSPKDMEFTYRGCGIPEDWIFTRAVLRGEPQPREDIQEKMRCILKERKTCQPVGYPTAGSTFRNPAGEKAWVLIDRAGCRGLKRGGAQISTKHCNFLLNLGKASAKDVKELCEEVRQRVLDTSGVLLEWEVVLWGC